MLGVRLKFWSLGVRGFGSTVSGVFMGLVARAWVLIKLASEKSAPGLVALAAWHRCKG